MSFAKLGLKDGFECQQMIHQGTFYQDGEAVGKVFKNSVQTLKRFVASYDYIDSGEIECAGEGWTEEESGITFVGTVVKETFKVISYTARNTFK